MPAHDRHVTRIVEDTVFLFVGRIMFLIDNNEAQLLKRQEQRRTGARNDPDLTLHHLPPHFFTRSRRKIGVPFSGFRTEPVMKTVKKLLGQGNFGQQDQHLPALFYRLGYRLEIDLRFAGTRNAIEQCHRESRFDMASTSFPAASA